MPPPPPGVVDNENTQIARLIGSPIQLFDRQAEDADCVGAYNIFKPAILTFFSIVNNPAVHQQEIRNMMTAFLQYSQSFKAKAATAGLIPPGPFNNEWVDTYYDMLYTDVPEDQRLSIVVQGGEAVNFYTAYKWDNVPTHDADTRILAGNYFNYLQNIATVPADVKRLMHRYRFFVSFGLVGYLRFFLHQMQTTPDFQEYTQKFLAQWGPGVTVNEAFSFTAILNGQVFRNKIMAVGAQVIPANITPYDINDDINIDRLITIEVSLNFLAANPNAIPHPINCSIVDLFVPSKHPGDNHWTRVGQSDRIHTYFSTEQANNTVIGGGYLNPPGLIPSYDTPIQIDPSVPILGNNPQFQNLQLRLVPLGFILFETLRMLFVSKVFQDFFHANKMLKYKQKLVCLLSTLMRTDISTSVLNTCLGMKAMNVVVAQSLLGGGYSQPSNNAANSVPSQNAPPIPVENVSENESTTELTVAEKRQARLFSKNLLVRELKGEDVHSLELTSPIEKAGYFDFLSYQEPTFKDFRLPLVEEDIKEHFGDTSNEEVTKGGKRHKTQKQRKHRPRRYTRSKN